MKLSLFTDIGLRVLMRLAGDPERQFSNGELSEELKVSRNHLNKVVSRLAKSGYIAAKRGNQGGIALAKLPGEIRIGDVVAELEAETPLVDCFKCQGATCTLMAKCPLARRLAKARDEFVASLNAGTLQDVAI